MKKYSIVKIIGFVILADILLKTFIGDLLKSTFRIIGVNLISLETFTKNFFSDLPGNLINITISLFISYIVLSILGSILIDIIKELNLFIRSFRKEFKN